MREKLPYDVGKELFCFKYQLTEIKISGRSARVVNLGYSVWSLCTFFLFQNMTPEIVVQMFLNHYYAINYIGKVVAIIGGWLWNEGSELIVSKWGFCTQTELTFCEIMQNKFNYDISYSILAYYKCYLKCAQQKISIEWLFHRLRKKYYKNILVL